MKQLATSFSNPEGKKLGGPSQPQGSGAGEDGTGKECQSQNDLFQTQPYLLEGSVPSLGTW